MAKDASSEPKCMHNEMCLKRLDEMKKMLVGIDTEIRGNAKRGIKQRLASAEDKLKLLFFVAGGAALAWIGKMLGK